MKLYHASPRRFRHGDILTGGHPGGYGTAHRNVCLTNSHLPHGTIFSKAVAGNWFVYEVEPLYKLVYREENGEYQTRAARGLRLVGRAAVFAKRGAPGGRRIPFTDQYCSWVDPLRTRRVERRKRWRTSTEEDDS